MTGRRRGTARRAPVLMILLMVFVCFTAVFAGAEAISGRVKLSQVLQKEAYYHFFLGDYLGAGTRLRLIEGSEVVQNDPEFLNETRLLLGSLYLAWEMPRPAGEIFGELVEIFPPGTKRSRLLLIVQKMQYEHHFYQDAIRIHERLSSEKGFRSLSQSAYFAGISHLSGGQGTAGIKLLSTITPESRYFPYAQMSLAQSYFAMNETHKSLSLLQSLSRRKTEKSDGTVEAVFLEKSRLTLGHLLIEAGRFEDAAAALLQIPPNSPFYIDALFGIAWTHFKGKNELTAIVFFEDLIAKAPEHPYALEALNTLGHAYNRLEAYRKALEHYEAALTRYREKEKTLQLLVKVIRDRKQLSVLVDLYLTTGEGVLADLIFSDRIASRIAQYGELKALGNRLDRKLSDMAIFDLIVNHREVVFLELLPSLDPSLQSKSFLHLNAKASRLTTALETAIQEENLAALASPEEEERLKRLSEAVTRSRTLGKKMFDLQKNQALSIEQRASLRRNWEKVNRSLVIAKGMLISTMITEVPGRADDLRRKLKSLLIDLQSLAEQHQSLVDAAPDLSQKIKQFRKRIATARVRLVSDKEEGFILQEEILKSLQAVLTEELERQLVQVADGIAVSELSRIQILDLEGGA